MSKCFLIESRDPSEGAAECLEGLATELRPVGAGALPGLFDEYAQVWHW